MIGRCAQSDGINLVDFDFPQAIFTAFEHFASLGHPVTSPIAPAEQDSATSRSYTHDYSAACRVSRPSSPPHSRPELTAPAQAVVKTCTADQVSRPPFGKGRPRPTFGSQGEQPDPGVGRTPGIAPVEF